MSEKYIIDAKTKHKIFLGKEMTTLIVKDLSELDEIISTMLRNYILDCKYERLNLCFFKREYKNCTKKQVDYVVSLLENNFEYYLTAKQVNFISKLSINEISKLIDILKHTDWEFFNDKIETICASEVEGSIYCKNI